MAKVRNISLDDRIVPELGRVVQMDEVAEVPDDRLWTGYLCPSWSPYCPPGHEHTWEFVEGPDEPAEPKDAKDSAGMSDEDARRMKKVKPAKKTAEKD